MKTKIFYLIALLIINYSLLISDSIAQKDNVYDVRKDTMNLTGHFSPLPYNVNIYEKNISVPNTSATDTLWVAFKEGSVKDTTAAVEILPGWERTFFNFTSDSVWIKGASGRTILVYVFKGSGRGTTLTNISGSVSSSISNLPSSYNWSQARFDSLYALLGTLNKQNGIDTVYNKKDTLVYIDTIRQGDSVKIRNCKGFKYVTVFMFSSAATDTLNARVLIGSYYVPVGVYDNYNDAKYQSMIPGANTNRGYLINMPNPGVIWIRRTNAINLSNQTILIIICTN